MGCIIGWEGWRASLPKQAITKPGGNAMPGKLLSCGLFLILAIQLAACNTTSDAGIPTATQAAVTPTPAGKIHSVVIDTDMAADDWMAILYLLQRPEVDVKAITVT